MEKRSRRQAITYAVAVLIAVVGVWFLLPKIAGLQEIFERIREGDPLWLAVAICFEILSFGGYVVLFRTIFVSGRYPIGLRESYQITMAGLAATRFFAAGGAGGIALTYWAVRRSGMPRREVVLRLVSFMVALYGVFVLTLLIDGIFLRTGIFAGRAPFEVTVIPAAFAGVVALIFVLSTLIPGDVERRLERLAQGRKKIGTVARRLATGPALIAAGTRRTLRLTRERHIGLLGAPAWWAFDVMVLWACFHAFGDAPPPAVLVMGYFVGMIANLLPFFPGGVGAVDLGMIAAFKIFGVPADAAIVAVLSYRGIAFWLPTIPGVFAYLQLRKTIKGWQSGEEDEEVEPGSVVSA